MNPLAELLSQDSRSPQALCTLLDEATHQQRVTWTRSLPRKLLKVLYQTVGQAPLSGEALVPSQLPKFSVVRHFGTNSMPSNRVFEKLMYRDEQGQVCGRNHQTFSALTGPGYYTAGAVSNSPEWVLDYVTLPTTTPQGWPKVTNNARGISYFVFRGLRDTLRCVSEHVAVGEVARDGKYQGQYFILVRES